MNRCEWCKSSSIYIDYHDKEWGVPQHENKMLYEQLCLEGLQAGLSWIVVLKKREHLRQAFQNFNPEKIAQFNRRDVQKLMNNKDIIRSKMKIEGIITNARAWIKIMESGNETFHDLLWKYVNFEVQTNQWRNASEIPTKNQQSRMMAKELKQRNFKFVGAIICYAFMQATGMINDHLATCFRHNQIKNF